MKRHLAVFTSAALVLPSFLYDVARADDEPRCGAVFQRWQDQSAPRQIVWALGVAHELAGAEDCLSQGKKPLACAHYARVQAQLGADAPEGMADRLARRMQEAGCS